MAIDRECGEVCIATTVRDRLAICNKGQARSPCMSENTKMIRMMMKMIIAIILFDHDNDCDDDVDNGVTINDFSCFGQMHLMIARRQWRNWVKLRKLMTLNNGWLKAYLPGQNCFEVSFSSAWHLFATYGKHSKIQFS